MGFPKLEVLFQVLPPPVEKEATKLRCVEVHPAKPWVACVDEGENVTVWDFDRKELVGRYTPQALREQQLECERTNLQLRAHVQAGHPVAQGSEADESGSYYERPLRTGLTQAKVGAVQGLGFFDADYVCSKLNQPPPLSTSAYVLREWLLIVTEHRFMMVDLLSGECRHLTSHDLSKHTTVTSVEAAGHATLALGCSDGHVRLWDVKSWASQGPAVAGHVKEVVRMAAVMPADTPGTSIRLVTLGLEGGLLLWRSNEDPRSDGDPCVIPSLDSLRVIGRLDGAVPLKAEASVRPQLMYNRYADSLSLMDTTRTVSVWDLYRVQRDGPSPAHHAYHRKRASTLGGSVGTETGSTMEVVTIPRVTRYKPPSSLGKLHDITTAITPQFPSRSFLSCDKTGLLHVLDDAGAVDDVAVAEGVGRDSPKAEEPGLGGAPVKAQLSVLEEFDLRPLISSDKQTQSRLKLLTVCQHPSRSQAFVVTHSLGLSVLLLDRHVQRTAAVVQTWGPSCLLTFEQGSLLRASVRLDEPHRRQAVHRTGCLAHDLTIASDLTPVTSGPGVQHAVQTIAGVSAAEAAQARANAARKRPDLLVSRSCRFVAVFWPAVTYYIVLPLPPPPETPAPPPSAPSPAKPVHRSSSNISSSSIGGSTSGGRRGPPPSVSLSAAIANSSATQHKAAEVDVGPALAVAWIGGGGKAGSSGKDLLVIVSPGGEARVPLDGAKKKGSLLFHRKKTDKAGTMGGQQEGSYVPASIIIKELALPEGGGAATLLTLSLVDESVLVNPLEAWGGHDDVVLAGWLPENLPPADDREHLRQMTSQFCRALPVEGQQNKIKLCKFGPTLPPVVSLTWDTQGDKCCVVTLEHGVHIYRLTPGGDDLAWTATLRPTSPAFEVPMSVWWQHGALVYATQSSVNLVIVPSHGQEGCDDTLIAHHTHRVPPGVSQVKVVVSVPLGDTTEEVVLAHRDPEYHSESKPFRYMWDCITPHPQAKPRGQLQILGVLEGGLLCRSPWSQSVCLLALDHPSLRASMLLAAGHVTRAVAWAKAVEPHLHDDLALHIFHPHGPRAVDEALRGLSGISLGVAMDLCIRHGLTSALCQHLSSARDVIDLLDQVDLTHTADPAGTAYIERHALANVAGQGACGAASVRVTPKTQATIRRVAVVLALSNRLDVVRDLLLPACRRKGRDEDAAFIVHLLKDDQLSREVLVECGQANVAAILQYHKDQSSLGMVGGDELSPLVKHWQDRLVTSQRPPSLFGDVQLQPSPAM